MFFFNTSVPKTLLFKPLLKSTQGCFVFFYFQSFLKNERENALLAVIEQTRKHVSSEP